MANTIRVRPVEKVLIEVSPEKWDREGDPEDPSVKCWKVELRINGSNVPVVAGISADGMTWQDTVEDILRVADDIH